MDNWTPHPHRNPTHHPKNSSEEEGTFGGEKFFHETISSAMANSILFPPNSLHLLSTKPTITSPKPHLSSFLPFNTTTTFNLNPNTRTSSCTPRAAVSSVSFPQRNPINVDYLEKEFGGHGVSFAERGDDCSVKMTLENGSVVLLLLPAGVITSYKPLLWHGGTQEILHTVAISGQGGGNGGGKAGVIGGVSLALCCETDGDDGSTCFSWTPSNWALNDVRGDVRDSIQVDLLSSDSENRVQVKYQITLTEDTLSSEFSVFNSSSSLMQLEGSVLSHLSVSTPDATYAIGLEGSIYYDGPPMSSHFSLIPPSTEQKKTDPSPLQTPSFGKFLPSGNEKSDEPERKSTERYQKFTENEETANYKHLTDKMSRIYTSAPRNLTIMDRGKRNSVVVGRKGFEELYMYSPGSTHEWYGKYAYVCVGQSAMLKPILLGPSDVWRAEQRLHNPNL